MHNKRGKSIIIFAIYCHIFELNFSIYILLRFAPLFRNSQAIPPFMVSNVVSTAALLDLCSLL